LKADAILVCNKSLCFGKEKIFVKFLKEMIFRHWRQSWR